MSFISQTFDLRILIFLILSVTLAGCAGRGAGVIEVKAAGNVPEFKKAMSREAWPPTRVKVREDDSLWKLSDMLFGSGEAWPALAAANKIKDPYIILPNQWLEVPRPGQLAAWIPDGVSVAKIQALAKVAPPGSGPKAWGWKRRVNSAFTVGEKLTFAVQYFSVTGGYATLSIPEIVEKSGRPTFHIVAEARTHPFFETFFKVRDKIESFMDVDYLHSWAYEKHLREGGYSNDTEYIIDQRNHKVTDSRGRSMDIGMEAVQDVMSCFYYFRTFPLEPGDKMSIWVAADNMKYYELIVNVVGREKQVKTLAGKFDTIVVVPQLKHEGMFKQRGEVRIWISDDERRLPVKIQAKIAIGAININLQEAQWVRPALSE